MNDAFHKKINEGCVAKQCCTEYFFPRTRDITLVSYHFYLLFLFQSLASGICSIVFDRFRAICIQIDQIVQRQFDRLSVRMKAMGIEAVLSKSVRSMIGQASWDPIYGARPVKRTLQKHILDPLAVMILEGKFGAGDTVHVDLKDGDIVFRKN